MSKVFAQKFLAQNANERRAPKRHGLSPGKAPAEQSISAFTLRLRNSTDPANPVRYAAICETHARARWATRYASLYATNIYALRTRYAAQTQYASQTRYAAPTLYTARIHNKRRTHKTLRTLNADAGTLRSHCSSILARTAARNFDALEFPNSWGESAATIRNIVIVLERIGAENHIFCDKRPDTWRV